MKKNFVFIAVAILIGLFLTVTQVFAAAPGISMSKKTPPPANPSSSPATGVDKPEDENNGNGKPENTGKPANTGKPEKNNKPASSGKTENTTDPEKKAKPVNFRGEIAGISEDAGTTEVFIQLQNGGGISVVVNKATLISVPTIKKSSPGAILAEGMQVVVKAHEDANKNLLADTIHVVPAAPLHIHHSGNVTAYVEDQSITIAKGGKQTTFTITDKTTILPKDAKVKVGDWVTIIATIPEEPDNPNPALDPDPNPGPGDDSGRTALAIVLLPGK